MHSLEKYCTRLRVDQYFYSSCNISLYHTQIKSILYKYIYIYVLYFLTQQIPGDPIREGITNAILQLQEADEILNLKIKWWKTGHCQVDDGSEKDANELGLRNIGGIFLVLIAGLVLGILVAVVEFVWKSRENAEIDRVSVATTTTVSWRV